MRFALTVTYLEKAPQVLASNLPGKYVCILPLGSNAPLPLETKETPANPSKNFFIAFPSQARELRDTINVIYGLDQRWTRVLSM